MRGPRLYAMAWRNLWRNRRRTLITLFALVFGFFMAFFFQGLTDQSLGDAIDMGAVPTNATEGYTLFVERTKERGLLEEFERKVREKKQDVYDTHPSFDVRAEALRHTVPVEDRESDARPAGALFAFDVVGTEKIEGRTAVVVDYRQTVPNDRFGFNVIYEAPAPVKPDPYLVWQEVRVEARRQLRPANLRLVVHS